MDTSEIQVVLYKPKRFPRDVEWDPWRKLHPEKRYCVISATTGEILDDAQGYGYKSVKNALAAYPYKVRYDQRHAAADKKAKDTELADRVHKWMNRNGAFVADMNNCAESIKKGEWAEGITFSPAFVRGLLAGARLNPKFSAEELFEVWKASSKHCSLL